MSMLAVLDRPFWARPTTPLPLGRALATSVSSGAGGHLRRGLEAASTGSAHILVSTFRCDASSIDSAWASTRSSRVDEVPRRGLRLAYCL